MEANNSSLRPYMIRALHEWIEDQGFTPHIVVDIQIEGVNAPFEFAENNHLVLNLSSRATGALSLGNEVLDFSARFAGVSRQITIPVNAVVAIYARENGEGMVFTVADETAQSSTAETTQDSAEKPKSPEIKTAEGQPVKSTEPFLKLVK